MPNPTRKLGLKARGTLRLDSKKAQTLMKIVQRMTPIVLSVSKEELAKYPDENARRLFLNRRKWQESLKIFQNLSGTSLFKKGAFVKIPSKDSPPYKIIMAIFHGISVEECQPVEKF